MARTEGTDPDIQTRPLVPPGPEHDVPDDAELDRREPTVEGEEPGHTPEELADDRGPLPETAQPHPDPLPDDEREVPVDEPFAADGDDDEQG
jgi:hypothetical protein